MSKASSIVASAIAACLVTSLVALPARAEVQTLRIGETYGLTHLPSYIVEDLKLIEKQAAKRGIKDLKVQVSRVGNGNVVTDLLLSGNIDVAISGVIPFMVLWDKTRGPNKVRAIASMSECNVFLFSADPKIASLDDYSGVDRIAMTDVKSTTWALILQMAAAKKYGWEQRQKFEPLSVAMANGEATAAMLSGKTEVKSHMTMLPFSQAERSTNHIKTILSSRDVLGGRYSAAVAFSTEKFDQQNPNVAAAVSDAFDEAMEFITKNPEEAAKIYNKHEPQKSGVEGILKMMDPNGPDELQFHSAPAAFEAFAEFMNKSGMIKAKANSWKDFFFERAWSRSGS
jgi:NitT/TauT family transport system substrate-binding protein